LQLQSHAHEQANTQLTEALPPLRIAIAEDNAVNRMVIRGLLGKLEQHQLDFYESGQPLTETLQLIPQKYDVIFMDIEMPVMDGYQATRKIRQLELELGIHTLIIGLSANALREQEQKALQCGMDDYLRKPVRLEDLRTSLMRHIKTDSKAPARAPASSAAAANAP
jgi:CheY-like chemotaxis protein